MLYTFLLTTRKVKCQFLVFLHIYTLLLTTQKGYSQIFYPPAFLLFPSRPRKDKVTFETGSLDHPPSQPAFRTPPPGPILQRGKTRDCQEHHIRHSTPLRRDQALRTEKEEDTGRLHETSTAIHHLPSSSVSSVYSVSFSFLRQRLTILLEFGDALFRPLQRLLLPGMALQTREDSGGMKGGCIRARRRLEMRD